MDLILQAWGGSFYLINKIFFALAEGKKEKTKRWLKLSGWIIYILGVPAWVIILINKHDWIAAAIEAGGLPAMLFGLVYVYQNTAYPNKTFDWIALLSTYGFLLFGVCYSIYDYGGLSSVSQLLEIGVMVGFLSGSYLLAKNNSYGWLFFVLMNASMGSLMALQRKPILAAQQLVSLYFVLYGFTVASKTNRKSKKAGLSI